MMPRKQQGRGLPSVTTDAFLETRGEGAARLAAEIAEAERQERERLAEALHDDALQRLMVVRQDLAEAGEGGGDPAMLRSVRRQLDELTESLRAVTKAMHEDTLASMPLGAALERLAEDGARRGRLTVHTHVEAAATGDHDPFVLGVARELLMNVVKHARASAVEITVTMERDAVVIRVADDGRGMSHDDVERASHAGHMGHARLRRRLTAIGGAVDTGFSHEELVGASAGVAPFWPPDQRDQFDALVRDARLAGGTERQSMVLRRDGSRFPALIAARAMHDDQGGYAGMLVTVKDITALELAAERRRLELELSAVVATTNRLRGLLEAARAVVDEEGLDALLREIARTISEDLGWAVVINLYRPAWDDFVVATGHGVAPEGWMVLEGATYEWAEWTPLLDDRYERRGAYLVPAGEPKGERPGTVSWSPPAGPTPEGLDAWHTDDDLLIPFRHTHGHFLGILSLDAPKSGRRPSDAELDVLVAIAAHAALAVQHAQTAIQTARHAAALDRLLHVSSRIAATREIGPMLETVAQAISDALGFDRVLVEVGDAAGALRPRASRDAAALSLAVGDLAPLAPGALAPLLDPGFHIEGCYLLSRDEALDRVPAPRAALLGSRRNGRGWRAWDDHMILVPLHGMEGEVVGVIWVDDPIDRLLPGNDRLQALHAFANQATAAMIAADRYERLATVSDGDPLTQLGNRRAFLRELEREVARTSREGGSSVLVLADASNCMALQEGGDPLRLAGRRPDLRELAAAFEDELRRQDRAFRIDGSLFGMILTGGQRPPETTAVTLRIAARLSALGARDGVRIHFGTATLGPVPERPDVVFHRAALSLLEARRTGTTLLGVSA
jgi:PAS domain S-box-containing protein